MEKPKRAEKRRSFRAQLTVPVRYRLFQDASVTPKDFINSHTNDISVNGLKLAVKQHYPSNTKLEMEIEFPPSTGIKGLARVVGNVVGSGNYKIGDVVDRFNRVAFVDVDKKAQMLILRLVFEVMKQKSAKKK